MQTQTSLERLQALLPEVFNPQPRSGELYLKFRLGPSLNAAISLERVVETLRLPAQNLTPIPNMPPCHLGLMTTQGKVFWAIDLTHLLGRSPNPQRLRQYDIIVVQALPMESTAQVAQATDDLLLGLSVTQIQRTLRLEPEQIVSGGEQVPPELVPYLQGQVHQDGAEELLIFNIEALSSARSLQGK